MIDRAARLEAAILVCGLVHEPAEAALLALEDVPLLTVEQWDAWRALDSEDVALLAACLDAEFALRAREWAALDRLGAALAMGDDLAGSMLALAAMVDLGWDRSVQPIAPGPGAGS
ncbi:hypothetical protein [Baekduia sp. Peel2402]|uniref:hypothetical protein n=1 Tax=Baekduia sp. Peel2402 TaxID=3458296 RepID=UPI00403ECE5D